MAVLKYRKTTGNNKDAFEVITGVVGPKGDPGQNGLFSNIQPITSTSLFYYPVAVSGSYGADGAGYYNDNIKIYNNVLFGAAWNDYAEYRKGESLKPGTCVIEVGDGTLTPSTERLQRGASIVSDTFGFAIGQTEECQLPIAVCGRVLAYTYQDKKEYHAGDPVCTGPNGTIDKMTDEEVQKYPDRIIGFVSEIPTYMIWKGNINIAVDDRIWIRVK